MIGRLDAITNRFLISEKKAEHYYFMFNDILVKTSAQGGLFHKNCTYTFKKVIQFDSVTVEDDPKPSKNSGNNHNHNTTFCLVPDEVYKETDPIQQKKKRKKLQYRFGCISEEEKLSWMRDMSDAINVRKLMKELGAPSAHGGGTTIADHGSSPTNQAQSTTTGTLIPMSPKGAQQF